MASTVLFFFMSVCLYVGLIGKMPFGAYTGWAQETMY